MFDSLSRVKRKSLTP